MALRTVQVPTGLEPVFARAEEVVSSYFAKRLDQPEHGTIEIAGERYVVVRAASLSVEFFTLVEGLFGEGRTDDARTFARNVLFDLSHAIGKSDAHAFHAKMGLDDPIARLSAGPVHFAHAGWASVEIHAESHASPDEEFFLSYDHPYSFEADAWLKAGRTRAEPACIMNAGYSSGWCTESFGIELVATEYLCRACGDATCRFVMAPPSRIEAHLTRVRGAAFPVESSRTIEIPDFFQRKRMEDELRRAHDDLEVRVIERTVELREANANLEREMREREEAELRLRQAQKLEALGRMSGGIAHDFNNLMSIVLSRGDLLDRKLAGRPEERAQLAEILQAAERASKLTRQLLAFSRAPALHREVIELGAALDRVKRMLELTVGDQIELRFEPPRGPLHVEMDRSQLEQVLVNLATNARDAMSRVGSWTLGFGRVALATDTLLPTGVLAAGEYVVVHVTDTGTGMSRDVVERIFDPFFTTKPEGEGTGLGLSTVYAIVTGADGGIDVRSEVGRGTRFDVYLPRVAAVRPAQKPSVAPPPDVRVHGTETVLIVDDRPELREVIAECLRGYGYQPIVVDGPEAALALAADLDVRIDALVTDVIMPKMNGPTLATHVRELRPDVAVLFVSGYSETTVTPLLPKPFRPQALAAKLREVIDAARAPTIA